MPRRHRHRMVLVGVAVLALHVAACKSEPPNDEREPVGQVEHGSEFDPTALDIALRPIVDGLEVEERLTLELSGEARVRKRGAEGSASARTRYESRSVWSREGDAFLWRYPAARWEDEVDGEVAATQPASIEGSSWRLRVDDAGALVSIEERSEPPAIPDPERERSVRAELRDLNRERELLEAILAQPRAAGDEIELEDERRRIDVDETIVRLDSLRYLGMRDGVAVLELAGNLSDAVSGDELGTWQGELALDPATGWPTALDLDGEFASGAGSREADGTGLVRVRRTYDWPAAP